MFKRILLTFLVLFFGCAAAFSEDILVEIAPLQLYSTVNKHPQIGDSVDFVVVKDVYNGQNIILKNGALVKGIVTDREENDFYGKEAVLCVEQLKALSQNGKWVNLSGIILKKGNDHPILLDHVLGDTAMTLTRGGEAFLRPSQDIFNLYLRAK